MATSARGVAEAFGRAADEVDEGRMSPYAPVEAGDKRRGADAATLRAVGQARGAVTDEAVRFLATVLQNGEWAAMDDLEPEECQALDALLRALAPDETATGDAGGDAGPLAEACMALRLRVRDADRLAREVARLVRRGVVDARSPVADALLDYDERICAESRDVLEARLAAERGRRGALEGALERLLVGTVHAYEDADGWHAMVERPDGSGGYAVPGVFADRPTALRAALAAAEGEGTRPEEDGRRQR